MIEDSVVKPMIRILAFFLLLVAGPIVSAQHARPAANNGADHDLVKATSTQRTALLRCMDATKQVRQVAAQIGRVGSPWSRGRVSYDRSDLNALSGYSKQLDNALAKLIAAHDEFRKQLSETQEASLERRLNKLGHLQSELASQVSQLGHNLTAAKAGLGSPSITWNVHGIEKASDRWRSVDRKIARGMNTPE